MSISLTTSCLSPLQHMHEYVKLKQQLQTEHEQALVELHNKQKEVYQLQKVQLCVIWIWPFFYIPLLGVLFSLRGSFSYANATYALLLKCQWSVCADSLLFATASEKVKGSENSIGIRWRFRSKAFLCVWSFNVLHNAKKNTCFTCEGGGCAAVIWFCLKKWTL